MVERTKDENKIETWAIGRPGNRVSVSVYPQAPPMGPPDRPKWNWHLRHDNVYFLDLSVSKNVNCTLREWAQPAGDGAQVRAAVQDALGDEVHDQVDAAVQALLPKKTNAARIAG